MPENTVSRTSCPFEWCVEEHIDDWLNDLCGNPLRNHLFNIGPWDVYPYLNVVETRTVDGVQFSSAVIHFSDSQTGPVEQLTTALHDLLTQIPDWRAIVRDLDEMRAAL